MHFLLTLVIFFLILGALIFVHELGHFLVAKWLGMRVDEFAIGFPPRIWSRRRGDTVYAINAVPFGGYVKIHGEQPENQDEDPNSFEKKSVWARMAVVLAGVTMNVLFAFVILTVAFSVGFVSISQNLTDIKGAVVRHSEVYIADVQKDSAAAVAGLEPGDQVQSFESPPDSPTKFAVNSVQDLVSYTKDAQTAGNYALGVNFVRDGQPMHATASLAHDGPPLGVYIQPYSVVRVPLWQAPVVAVKEIGAILTLTWDALANFGRLLVQQAKLDPTVSGPVGIYQATGAATQAGFIPTIFLVVALSLNLALLNILPIPALDGGKFLFLVVEAVARKRIVGRKLESAITFAGFVLLIGLILVLSVRDVIRLF